MIYKPAGKSISDKILETCWNKNKDGAGYMFAHNGQVIIRKGFFKFKSFMTSLRLDSTHTAKNKDVVIHFRYATHGKIDKVNCHPHRITDKLAFAHNGIINIDVPSGSQVSDTIIFGEKILKQLPDNWLKKQSYVELVGRYIGNSKLVFLSGKGDVNIIHQELGEWYEGCWYSNGGFRSAVPRSYTGTGKLTWHKDTLFDTGQNTISDAEVQEIMGEINDYQPDSEIPF